MTASLERIARRPLASLGVIAATVAIIAGLLVFAIVLAGGESSSDGSSRVGTESTTATPNDSNVSGGVGGGGDPPAYLMEVFNSLPVPSGAAIDAYPFTTGVGLESSFWGRDEPAVILDFYSSRLPALGWQPEELATTVTSDPKLDGTRGRSSYSTFVKDDLRLLVSAGPNTKSPARGASHFFISILPASEPVHVTPVSTP